MARSNSGVILNAFSYDSPHNQVSHARDLHPHDQEQWMDASQTRLAKARSLLKPYPEELMDAHDVSPIVNSAKYDRPECIQPVSDETYHALGSCPAVSTTVMTISIELTMSLATPAAVPPGATITS